MLQKKIEGDCLLKQYKVVPGPMSFSVAKKGTQAAFDAFSRLINQEAVNGWEYHSMETITITEKPGCLQNPIPTNYYMLIFVREA